MCDQHPVTNAAASAHWSLSRRTALKLALAAGVIGAPVIAGGRLLLESNGRPAPAATPFIAPPDEDGTPAAILIAYTDRANPAIWLELLRVEGLPNARALPLAAVTAEELRAAAVVVLLPGALDAGQVAQLRDYAEAGGGLVVITPDADLAAVCGLADAAGVTNAGYLCVAGGVPGADGIESGALQFHAPLRHYQLREADAVALVCSREALPTTTPAVTWRRLGRGGVVTWCYDLAQSVVFSRQGPPARANAEQDNLDGVRAVDMFPGFIDLERIHVPQADEQQRLLVNLINELSTAPLPRLWYFPANVDSALVLTGDSHNNPALAVDAVLRRVEAFGGTMSVYYTPPPTDTVRRAVRRVRTWLDAQPVVGDLVPPSDVVTPYHAEQWRARGHEFALHPYVEEGLEIGWARYWQQFTGLGYGAFDTTRTHRVLWHGWTDTARVQAEYAVHMNLDYYHVGPIFQRADGSWVFGYFTGSGLPMRFVDAEGRLIDNWQQTTHLVDEQVIEMPWGANFAGTSPEAAIEIANDVIGRAARGAYAALGVQCHFDPFAVPGPWTAGAARYLDGVLSSGRTYGLPILAATQWLAFTQARAGARIVTLPSDTAALFRWSVQVAAPDKALTLLIPVQYNAQHLTSLQANRKQIAFQTRKVGATLYAVAPLASPETVIEARYATV
ncbi:MAG TPA: hypothetical protein DCL15_19500 [Chloroflexi bacterium]|nr:hypothetical protein [Chloroflexota bacterium]HHW86208.1 hypothetical protein [Chloroflexota bacterium]